MSYQNDVANFMKAGEQPVRSELSLEGDQATLYMNLISEGSGRWSCRYGLGHYGDV